MDGRAEERTDMRAQARMHAILHAHIIVDIKIYLEACDLMDSFKPRLLIAYHDMYFIHFYLP